MNILVNAPADPSAVERLRHLSNVRVRIACELQETPHRWPLSELQDVEVFLGNVLPMNIGDMRQLRLVQLGSSGYSQVYGLKLHHRRVRVCNARGISDPTIAEWNLAMMVNLARDLRGMLRNQWDHRWDRPARFQREIRGLRVGIWGYGGIGRETARLAHQVGMSVHVLSRSRNLRREHAYTVPGTGDPDGVLPQKVFSPEEVGEFLLDLDFLILAMPHTRQTEGIVGEKELKLLPPTAFLLNPARGPLVDEGALVVALREGWIAGAALDAHFRYPLPPDHPLWDLDNVILTPHISGSTGSPYYVPRLWDLFVQNVERFHNGQTLLNELTAEQLEGD